MDGGRLNSMGDCEKREKNMAFTREQSVAMQLAGTVSFPPTLPNLVRIALVPATAVQGKASDNGKAASREMILTEQSVSARVMIRRYFSVADVTAIQASHGESSGGSGPGVWYLGQELTEGAMGNKLRGPGVWGIAYVREQAQTLMQVDVGMTAAESAEYYPPLPGDRSHDHYQFGAVHSSASVGLCSSASSYAGSNDVDAAMKSISWCSSQRSTAQPMQYASQPMQYAAQPNQYAAQPNQYAAQPAHRDSLAEPTSAVDVSVSRHGESVRQ